VRALLHEREVEGALKKLRDTSGCARVTRTMATAHNLQVEFATQTLELTGVNRKRVPCERDPDWEREHRVVCRKTTCPHRFEGSV